MTNIALLALMLAMASALAEDKPTANEAKLQEPPQALTKFDLDFKGGRPKDLVAAIQKATGKSMNAVIPDEYANVTIPELKMKNVETVQLFRALDEASRKTEYVRNPDGRVEPAFCNPTSSSI